MSLTYKCQLDTGYNPAGEFQMGSCLEQVGWWTEMSVEDCLAC